MDDLKIEAPADAPSVVITRTFDAPRALVWKALSEPEHVVRWFGPHDHKNRVVAYDFRVGGKWHIETTTKAGQVINFFGEFREIEPVWKQTQTFSFDGLPDGTHSLDTTTLEEVDGKTLYRQVSVVSDMEMRDGMIASGMEHGVREGFERLDAMLEEFKAEA